MSKVYKPIDLVSTENDYKSYAIVSNDGKTVSYLNSSEELKELFEKCNENELSIYTLQSVVRAEEVNSSDDYDDDDDDDDEDLDLDVQEIDIDDTIDEITQAFNDSLKKIVSKLK